MASGCKRILAGKTWKMKLFEGFERGRMKTVRAVVGKEEEKTEDGCASRYLGTMTAWTRKIECRCRCIGRTSITCSIVRCQSCRGHWSSHTCLSDSTLGSTRVLVGVDARDALARHAFQCAKNHWYVPVT